MRKVFLMATAAESKRIDQMTYKELVKEYDRCLRALRSFPNFTPGSSAESNRERNALHHRIVDIVRAICALDPRSAGSGHPLKGASS